jgi:hypothetical protein
MRSSRVEWDVENTEHSPGHSLCSGRFASPIRLRFTANNLSSSIIDTHSFNIITMGALKHVILPAFGILHAYMALHGTRDLATFNAMVGLPAPTSSTSGTTPPADDSTTTMTTTINHLLAWLRGFHFSACILCFSCVTCQGQHRFRGQLALAETVVFGMAAYDAYKQKFNHYKVWPMVATAVAGIGAVLNRCEPGIFTKSKIMDSKY